MKQIKKTITKSLHGSRHDRKLKKYSDSFNETFLFFYKISKSDIVSFCGSEIKVSFDKNGLNAKECFRRYNDGQYQRVDVISTKHSNLLSKVIQGKKGWGLWCQQWSEGISENSFTIDEILTEFKCRNIQIPEQYMIEFLNLINKFKIRKYENYLKKRESFKFSQNKVSS